MKRNYIIIASSLTVAMFIYMFYRTECTVINRLFIYVSNLEIFTSLKSYVTRVLHLPDLVMYSLPEGLWILCISILSAPFYIKIFNTNFSLYFLPIIYSIGLEFCQLFGITKGIFDFLDIGVSMFFWLLSFYLTKNNQTQFNLLQSLNLKSIICIFSYLIVYLSHVWN